MILSYLTHKKIELINPGITVLATKSQIVYRDWVQSFNNKSNMLLCCDDQYDEVAIDKAFDFVGDPLLDKNIVDKYLPVIVKKFISDLDESNRTMLMKRFRELENSLYDSLMLEDVPLEISFEEDLQKLLKIEKLHFNSEILKDPYAIIETIMKVHELYDLETIPVICNALHYLEEDQLIELSKLTNQMKLKVVLIEFTDRDFMVVPEDVGFYYIDQDLVDWY